MSDIAPIIEEVRAPQVAEGFEPLTRMTSLALRLADEVEDLLIATAALPELERQNKELRLNLLRTGTRLDALRLALRTFLAASEADAPARLQQQAVDLARKVLEEFGGAP